MPRLPAFVAVLVCLAGTLAPALAADQVLTLSVRESKVTFTLDATAHTVHGTIPLTSGTIRFDPGTGRASGEIVLDLARAATGNARRDADMHGKVLQTGRYPSAVFRPEALRGSPRPTGSSAVTVSGSLLFHGKEHRIEVPARVTLSGTRLTGEGRLTIPYVAWGLTDPSKFVLRVGKTVEVTLRLVGELR